MSEQGVARPDAAGGGNGGRARSRDQVLDDVLSSPLAPLVVTFRDPGDLDNRWADDVLVLTRGSNATEVALTRHDLFRLVRAAVDRYRGVGTERTTP